MKKRATFHHVPSMKNLVVFFVFRFQETAGMIGVQFQSLDDSLFGVETLCSGWNL